MYYLGDRSRGSKAIWGRIGKDLGSGRDGITAIEKGGYVLG